MWLWLLLGFTPEFGGWRVRLDEQNATPRVLTGPAVPRERAPELASQVARRGGVDPATLELEEQRHDGDLVGIRYRQTWKGAPVVGGTLDLVGRGGGIVYVVAGLHHVDLQGEPLEGEWVLPRGAESVFVTRWQEGADVVWRDRAGVERERETRRVPIEMVYPEREPAGALMFAPARQITVSDGISTELTDDDGYTPLAGPYYVELDGPLVTVYDGSSVASATSIADGVLDPNDIDPSATAALAHFYAVRDWLEQRDPTHPWLDVDVDVMVDVPGSCNAFYVGGGIELFDAGDGCGDTAQMADVVYHEIGHGIHDYGLVAGDFEYDVSEGSADFVSATINDDPGIALGFYGPGTYLREVETDLVWPEDQSFDTHITGLIWAGFFWDVRTELVDQLGYELGTETVDRLFLDTLKLGPAIDDFEAILASDDDNDDLSDGTPHDCLLLEHGAAHGLAPAPITAVEVALAGPGDLPSGTPLDPPTPVAFQLDGAGLECAGLEVENVRLHWSTDPSGTFTEVPAAHTDGSYLAEIPPQPAGTEVVFYVTWTDGETVVSSHREREELLFRYWVGDQVDLWCDGFEGDVSGWSASGGALDGEPEAGVSEFEWGAPPAARAFGATEPAEGSVILGQRLSDGLTYRPDNEQHVSSPVIELSGANRSLLLLTYQRWLSVQGRNDDRARVLVEELGPVWENPPSPTFDTGWTRVTHDVSPLVGDGEDLRFHLTLSTDGGVGFDGWNLDDVCVRTLAEVDRHYRGASLQASDDLFPSVEVQWTAPWVRPLDSLRLVRSLDGLPASPSDGEILWEEEDPAPGAPGSFTDERALPGQTWTYALFAADAEGHWYSAALGENADEGSIPTEPDEEQAPDPVEEKDEPEGCGCASGPRSAASGWLIGLLLWSTLRFRRFHVALVDMRVR